MKCEYCDNPVPNDVMRCPSCGASVKIIKEEGPLTVAKAIAPEETRQAPCLTSGAAYNPYLFVAKKNRIVYVILAVIFGEIGVHNFYAGFVGRGVAQLLITVLSFGFLFWISWIWAIIEICVVESDGRGIPFE